MKSKGLSFKKFDLHIHTPASDCFNDKDVTAEQIVDKCIEKELTGIAITDHNTGSWIDSIKEIAEDRGLVVFPGVEITVGDAHNHIIAILDVEKTKRDIEDLLTSVEILHRDFGKRQVFSPKSVLEVIETITGDKFNGIAVLAHIDSTNGVFQQMSGQPRIKVIQHPRVLAAEAINYQQTFGFLNGSDLDYKRKLAIYQSSDNPYLDSKGVPIVDGVGSGKHSLEGIGHRVSYFKVNDKVTLESLRQCFIDPDVRIRQSWEYKESVFPYIKSVKINSGFLNDVEANFHTGLNSILGATGAGKSLLIEFVRFALDQEPTHPEIRHDHNKKLEKRLGQYGEVEIIVCDETGKEFLITRKYDPIENNPISCKDLSTNEYIDVNIPQLFPVLCFSQNEIIKIAEDKKDEQMKFIDKFFDFRIFKNQIQNLDKELEELDREFAIAIKAYHEVKRLTKQLETTKLELSRFSKQLKDPIFVEIAKLEDKDKSFRIQIDYLKKLEENINQFINIVDSENIPALSQNFVSDPSLLRVKDIAKASRTSFLEALESQKEKLNQAIQKATTEYDNWSPLFIEKKRKFQEKVIELGGNAQYLEQQRKLKLREIENIEKRVSILKGKASHLKEIFNKRRTKLDGLKEIYSNYSAKRRERCEFFEKISNNKLKINIFESSNRDEFRARLNSLKKGSYLRTSEIEQLSSQITPYDFILHLLRYDILKQDKPEEASKNIKFIAEKTHLAEEKIKGLVDYLLGLIGNEELNYEDLLLLQYKAYPKDRPEIKYNIGDENNKEYSPLDSIATGQKCNAMLILALSDGVMPIIIDQPEDSVDIRSVWQDMCLKLRTGKENRQFVFTTHNSSVAVASDTDKFTIMTGTAVKGEIILAGSIDNKEMRKEIIDYLEGGLPTYKLKYKKYNISDKVENNEDIG